MLKYLVKRYFKNITVIKLKEETGMTERTRTTNNNEVKMVKSPVLQLGKDSKAYFEKLSDWGAQQYWGKAIARFQSDKDFEKFKSEMQKIIIYLKMLQ